MTVPISFPFKPVDSPIQCQWTKAIRLNDNRLLKVVCNQLKIAIHWGVDSFHEYGPKLIGRQQNSNAMNCSFFKVVERLSYVSNGTKDCECLVHKWVTNATPRGEFKAMDFILITFRPTTLA